MRFMQSSNFRIAAIKAATEAGKILVKNYGKVSETRKDNFNDIGSIVTVADTESEKKIISILKGCFPEHGFVGEEAASEKTDAGYVWYIDPLDGTSNFVRKIPIFGISIGLTYKQRPILGLLFFPILDLLVYAERGKGAYANGKRIHVSSRPIKDALYFAGGKYHGKNQIIKGLWDSSSMIKIISASSFELAQIAMGNGEIYCLESVPHDVVAGICIVREAGGEVTEWNGRPWTLGSKNVLITNRKVHKDALKAIDNREA